MACTKAGHLGSTAVQKDLLSANKEFVEDPERDWGPEAPSGTRMKGKAEWKARPEPAAPGAGKQEPWGYSDSRVCLDLTVPHPPRA